MFIAFIILHVDDYKVSYINPENIWVLEEKFPCCQVK